MDDRVNPVARNADRMSKLVLAHPDFAEKLFFENLARMGIAKLFHYYILRPCLCSMVVDDLDIESVTSDPTEANAPLIVDADTHLTGAVALEHFEPISGWVAQV